MWEPESQTRSCARVIPSVPEWAQIWAQIQFRENFEAGNCLKRMVGRDGIEPPTPGFSVLSPIAVSARNCLMWNARLPTASCAGVRWNDQECA